MLCWSVISPWTVGHEYSYATPTTEPQNHLQLFASDLPLILFQAYGNRYVLQYSVSAVVIQMAGQDSGRQSLCVLVLVSISLRSQLRQRLGQCHQLYPVHGDQPCAASNSNGILNFQIHTGWLPQDADGEAVRSSASTLNDVLSILLLVAVMSRLADPQGANIRLSSHNHFPCYAWGLQHRLAEIHFALLSRCGIPPSAGSAVSGRSSMSEGTFYGLDF
ncbi:hypothetical protein SCHPADRAFT_290154 [Schizopora paradoxa]|uniref:Uncharacterized protein n=1 Tax=Schizopora paradoxa TaxID=27342 RepID=A0A0H2RSQ7_9AGAM|nr:hypothetical protein SCHPADRAFT_290154 [Schizopora paradoxa]